MTVDTLYRRLEPLNQKMSSVVNCKVQYIRPKYNNLKEWMEDTSNVYIGRARIVFIDGERFPKDPSVFANPFRVGKDGTREEVVQKYKAYITERLRDEEVQKQFSLLKGKTLGCWCHPDPCHGDILLEMLALSD